MPDILLCRCSKCGSVFPGKTSRGFAFCPRCGTRQTITAKNSHPVAYSTRPWPRPWRRSKERITFPERPPQPYQPGARPAQYHPQPPQGKTAAAPADFQMNSGPEPQLLQPATLETPPVSIPAAARTGKSSAASAIFWGLFTLAALGAVIAAVVNPRLVGDLIERISELGNSSGSASSQCQKYYDAYIIHECYAGNPPKAGYRWCNVTLRGGGGSDWSLNGTNMSQSSEAQTYIPVECVK